MHKPGTIHRGKWIQKGPISDWITTKIATVALWAMWLLSQDGIAIDDARITKLQEQHSDTLESENRELLEELAELRKCYADMISALPEGIEKPPELFDTEGNITVAWKEWLSKTFPDEIKNMETGISTIRHTRGSTIAGNVEKISWHILAIWIIGGLLAWFIAWTMLPFSLACWRIAALTSTTELAVSKAIKIIERYYDIFYQVKRAWKFIGWIKSEPDIEAWEKVKNKRKGDIVIMRINGTDYPVTLGIIENWQAVGSTGEGDDRIFIHINTERVSIILPSNQIEFPD
jgi:hypothetical protein